MKTRTNKKALKKTKTATKRLAAKASAAKARAKTPSAVGKSDSAKPKTKKSIDGTKTKPTGNKAKLAVKDELASDLQPHFEKLRELRNRGDRDDALVKYEMGGEVVAIMDDTTYGESGVKLVAKKLEYNPKLLYEYAKVARRWSDGRTFRALLSRKNAKGVGISFSILHVLARVENDATRKDLLERTVTECWSVRELKAALGETKPKKTKAPSDIAARVARNADHALKKTSGDLKALDALGPGAARDDASRERFRVALETCRRTQALSAEIATKLEALLQERSQPEPLTAEAPQLDAPTSAPRLVDVAAA